MHACLFRVIQLTDGQIGRQTDKDSWHIPPTFLAACRNINCQGMLATTENQQVILDIVMVGYNMHIVYVWHIGHIFMKMDGCLFTCQVSSNKENRMKAQEDKKVCIYLLCLPTAE